MKCKSFLVVGVAFLILIIGCEKDTATSPSNFEESKIMSAGTNETFAKTPSIMALENSYEFPSVVDGIKVIHDFIIYNKGDGNLEISRVKTG